MTSVASFRTNFDLELPEDLPVDAEKPDLDVERRRRTAPARAEREVEFNGVLAEVCATWERCQYDGGVGYEYRFEAGEVSTNDYFHPSVRGQATIARIEFPLVSF